MRKKFVYFLYVLGFCIGQNIASAQTNLFSSDSVLQITLGGNIRDLLNDRTEDSKYHFITIGYPKSTGVYYTLAAEAKTRGHFRKLKENCDYPPLLLHFYKTDSLDASVFKELNSVKLVMPCAGDEYVIREWLVYKLYNILTPKSFNARLVNVSLYDTKAKKPSPSFYGILLEEEKQMAARNHCINVDVKLRPEQTNEKDFLTMAMFEYMIGNTDWGVQYLQNIKLISKDSTSVPSTVAYDFDHAGIVDAPYAKPAEELEMSSTHERRYRGFCMEDLSKFDDIIALFNKLKPAFYKVYTDCSLLDAKYVKATLKFLDNFYATINSASAFQKDFSYPCDKNGTGNVVIKGLKEE